jgi:hypothetical protein
MKRDRPVSPVKASDNVAPFKRRLTPEQLECLKRGARGVTLRFERSELIDALIEAGYAERGLAGVVTITSAGHEYLKKHLE